MCFVSSICWSMGASSGCSARPSVQVAPAGSGIGGKTGRAHGRPARSGASRFLTAEPAASASGVVHAFPSSNSVGGFKSPRPSSRTDVAAAPSTSTFGAANSAARSRSDCSVKFGAAPVVDVYALLSVSSVAPRSKAGVITLPDAV